MYLRHYKLNEWETKLVNMSNDDFDKYMLETYPSMFTQRNQSMQVSPMAFGFCVGAGWRHILDSLCQELKVVEDAFGLVCVFDQIKEKFGSGRFYYHIEDKNSQEGDKYKVVCRIIDDLVSLYEEYTEYVCEELGTNVRPDEKVSAGSWMYGCGLEGFKKTTHERVGDEKLANERIAMVEAQQKDVQRRRKIKEDLWDLKDEDWEQIEKMIESRKEERKTVT